MKNWEKYEDSIRTLGSDFGVTNDGKFGLCGRIPCFECIFTDCNKERIDWLYSEYEPPKPKLTAQEKAFLDCFETNYACIARDMNGRLYCYSCTPIKDDAGWNQNCSVFFELQRHLFKFISWDDEEPWSIEDLMELEVEG